LESDRYRLGTYSPMIRSGPDDVRTITSDHRDGSEAGMNARRAGSSSTRVAMATPRSSGSRRTATVQPAAASRSTINRQPSPALIS